MAALSKAWVCTLWLAGIAGSEPVGAWISASCEYYQVEIPATGLSLAQRSPIE
jgi:hypothetical protein